MMRLPYGISDFARLVRDGYHFVDHTPYVEKLEKEDAPYLFFLRPRRFGKSLFVSLLSYYYGIEHKDQFQALFSQYYIGQHPTPKANSYYILKFEFSRINTQTWESTFEGFRQNVIKGIHSFEHRYGSSGKNYESIHEPTDLLKDFFEAHPDKKIYLLIDEYDHFANEVLSFRYEEFMKMVTGSGFVRKFYESIKAATGEGIVERLFVTGVTPITLDSMTSGFNIGVHLSRNERFHSMLGFETHEVKQMIEGIVEGGEEKKQEVLEKMRLWYNGYRFEASAEQGIYNPDMVLYCLIMLAPKQKYPEDLIDPNIASDYGKLKKLFDLKERDQNYQVLEQLVHDSYVMAGITEQFSFEKRFTTDDFKSLLFYMGMLSIQGSELSAMKLGIPNFAIKGLYWKFFIEALADKCSLEFEIMNVREAIFALAQKNEIQPLLTLVETTLKAMSNRDFLHFDEKYVKLLLVAFVNQANVYFIKSEQEVDQRYPDILLLNRPPYFPNFQFVIEVKYLKKSQARKLSEVKQGAITQLQGYLQSEDLKAIPNLKAYVLVFVGEKAKVVQAL
ncbi:AAA family ATPase [Deltaproteobacteria bacterium TL4]